ncbi:hypothetical protein SteCoe_13238 [Stentor coeruleus]|uniref:VOC domain-containing protein n=1 Tax=Stentor coeruleus TaxID=5963 RepID=A0A1R2C901_9CILI|nr:hypothetical protein SteCoe_13238 [Stentor coeruleus]
MIGRGLLRLFSERPFKVLGVQQIALGHLDKSVLTAFWSETLGIPKIGNYQSEKENVNEDILRIGEGHTAVEIDLMQPIDPEKSPKVHKTALNHFGLWIDDLPACVKHLESKGVQMTPGGIRKGAAGFDVAFVHPKSTGGILLELVQFPK